MPLSNHTLNMKGTSERADFSSRSLDALPPDGLCPVRARVSLGQSFLFVHVRGCVQTHLLASLAELKHGSSNNSHTSNGGCVSLVSHGTLHGTLRTSPHNREQHTRKHEKKEPFSSAVVVAASNSHGRKLRRTYMR